MEFSTLAFRRKQIVEKNHAQSFFRKIIKLNPDAEISFRSKDFSDMVSNLTISDLSSIVIPENARFIGDPYETSFYGFVCILYNHEQYTIYVKDYEE